MRLLFGCRSVANFPQSRLIIKPMLSQSRCGPNCNALAISLTEAANANTSRHTKLLPRMKLDMWHLAKALAMSFKLIVICTNLYITCNVRCYCNNMRIFFANNQHLSASCIDGIDTFAYVIKVLCARDLGF